MPTYEYECTKCGAVTEVFHSMTEPARRKLKADDQPSCNCKATVKRRIGRGAGVIFKGAGFYETDYRSDSYKKAAEAEKSGGKKGEGTKDGKKKESSKKSESSSSGDSSKGGSSSGGKSDSGGAAKAASEAGTA